MVGCVQQLFQRPRKGGGSVLGLSQFVVAGFESFLASANSIRLQKLDHILFAGISPATRDIG